MRTASLIGLVGGAIAACGGTPASIPDGPTGNHPPPHVIAGGGIGDGAVDGVVNLYVIDDATRMPIVGATAQVGTVSGVTDGNGLLVATGVTGPQTIAVNAASYRSELWVGANGANMTVDLQPAIDPVPTSANLAGAIAGFGAIVVPAGHHKAALVTYSQSDSLGDGANNIPTVNATNFCDTALSSGGCDFNVTVRTGQVGLIAAIFDHDTTAKTFTVIGWATRLGIVAANGVNQTGQDLTLLDASNLATMTVSFGNPPSGLATVAAIVGIDVGIAGVFQLPTLLVPATPTLLVPKLAAITGSAYRLTGVASDAVGSTPATATSVVLVRNESTTALAAGTWLGVPTGLALTRTGGAWTALAGALIQAASHDQGTTHLLNVTAFDGSTTFTIPDALALPTTGALAASGTAIAGTLDLTNFSIDADKAKITAASSQAVTVN